MLAVLVAHTAWHWLIDRFAVLRNFHPSASEVFAAFIDGGLPWLVGVLVIATLGVRFARRTRRLQPD